MSDPNSAYWRPFVVEWICWTGYEGKMGSPRFMSLRGLASLGPLTCEMRLIEDDRHSGVFLDFITPCCHLPPVNVETYGRGEVECLCGKSYMGIGPCSTPFPLDNGGFQVVEDWLTALNGMNTLEASLLLRSEVSEGPLTRWSDEWASLYPYVASRTEPLKLLKENLVEVIDG